MDITIHRTFDIAAQTVASLYANVPAKALVLLIALILCFAGYRLMRWVSALYGVIAGLMVGICVTSLIPFGDEQAKSLILSVLAMVIGGLVLGALCLRFCNLGIFLVCGCIGLLVSYVPATFVAELSQQGFWCILLACGLLFGITGVLFRKEAYLIATSLSGIPAGFALTGLLDKQSVLLSLVFGGVLTVLGIICQLFLLRRMDRCTADAAENMLQDTDPNLPIVTGETEDEPDDIDKISSRVAEHIGMSGAYKTEPFMVSDDPEIVAGRTMVIPQEEQPVESEQEPQPVMEKMPEETEQEPQPVTEKVPEDSARFAWSDEEQIGPQKRTEQYQPQAAAAEPAETENDALEQTSAEEPIVLPEAQQDAGNIGTALDAAVGAEQQDEIDADASDADTKLAHVLAQFGAVTEQPADAENQPEEPCEQAAEQPMEEESAETQEEMLQELATERMEQSDQSMMTEPLPVEDTEEPETEEPAQPRKRQAGGMVLSVVLVAAALVFAAVGQYAELLLALCFAGYVRKRYRSAAFACAILCVRRAVDTVYLVTQQGSWTWIALDAVSCLAFLALTFVALRAYVRERQRG